LSAFERRIVRFKGVRIAERTIKTLRKFLFRLLTGLLLTMLTGLIWLHWDAGRSLQPWFDSRHGRLIDAAVVQASAEPEQSSELVTLTSDSGLQVTLRTIRRLRPDEKLPVLLILGGHRTGSDAARLFDDVGERAIVALDYPYSGPEKAKGIVPIIRTIPLARQAFRDTPPAITLVGDWLLQQDWVDPEEVVIVGASLGVPFATLAAASDERIRGALLIHGAANNELWLQAQVARRVEAKILHKPIAVFVHWLAYGPTFDTRKNVARIAPRPVLIVGARDDERTPAGQTELLFAAAGQPKWLRWTEGTHIEPDEAQIIDDLLQIAEEMLPFPARN
jgi:fermentation-respiration switch protein FrsA (DUF1100 family)